MGTGLHTTRATLASFILHENNTLNRDQTRGSRLGNCEHVTEEGSCHSCIQSRHALLLSIAPKTGNPSQSAGLCRGPLQTKDT
jgi:hypothetical protein